MSSKNVLILILTISAINGNEDYFDTDPELHSSAMNIILNRLSARLNRVLSEFRSDLLKSSMEMVQNEASILVKAFDLKMQNVSKMIEKEAENRQSLQITLNSIAESNRIRDDILADKTLMKEIQSLRSEMKHEKNQRLHLESQILQALQVRPQVEKMRVDLMNGLMDLKLNLSGKMDAEIQARNESMEEIRMDLDNALGLNHYDMILMQSDFDAKFLNLSQVLQQEKDMRILLSRELFELSFLKVQNEFGASDMISDFEQKLDNFEGKLKRLEKTKNGPQTDLQVLNDKISSSIVIGADCHRIGKCQGDILLQRTYFSHQLCLKACQGNPKCSSFSYDSKIHICILYQVCSKVDITQTTFRTGLWICPSSIENTKVLITTGDPISKIEKNEVIDLLNPNLSCQSIIEDRVNISRSSGALINGAMIVCGGTPNNQACNFLGTNQTLTMRENRYLAASVPINDTKLWITGGATGTSRLSDTEFITHDKTTAGPDLPLSINSHCLIPLNSNEYLLIGGNSNQGISDKTFLYDFKLGVWKTGPSLNFARNSHACGIMVVNTKRVAVVTGGLSQDGALDSTEFLNLELMENWEIGPKLPMVMSGHKMVSLGDSVVIIGGYFSGYNLGRYLNELYQLSCHVSGNFCQWYEMSQKLDFPRKNHLVQLIPDSLALCN